MSSRPSLAGTRSFHLHGRDGSQVDLPVEAWCAVADEVELSVLDRVVGPAIDLGSGPGRLVEALTERGVMALGVDASSAAVALADQRGVASLERSVFDRVPGAGRWRTAILLDGNIGIGGEPVDLLRRAAELLAPDGRVVVETAAPDIETRTIEVRLEGGGQVGPWFPWAIVGAGSLPELARAADLDVEHAWSEGGRWFAVLTPVPEPVTPHADAP